MVLLEHHRSVRAPSFYQRKPFWSENVDRMIPRQNVEFTKKKSQNPRFWGATIVLSGIVLSIFLQLKEFWRFGGETQTEWFLNRMRDLEFMWSWPWVKIKELGYHRYRSRFSMKHPCIGVPNFDPSPCIVGEWVSGTRGFSFLPKVIIFFLRKALVAPSRELKWFAWAGHGHGGKV